MRKIVNCGLLSFAILIMALNTADAQKCKYKLDEEDPMTNERIRRNQVKLKPYFIVSFYRKAEDLRVELNVNYLG